jgi:MYXO-CTERM domain-containing protein
VYEAVIAAHAAKTGRALQPTPEAAAILEQVAALALIALAVVLRISRRRR